MDSFKDFLIPFLFACLANFLIIFGLTLCGVAVHLVAAFFIGMATMTVAMTLYNKYKRR